ncbi:hypothetical protein SASPL_155169 [Salvia splendens]|uniref:AT-hook motif nuclear-localized protein n=1 Tax=Salvia splendens TaxID=180675 RepID=A0A8X8W1F3_SALSN|nr:hypothetical protein SASPL_155169 [Salvia splendens]
MEAEDRESTDSGSFSGNHDSDSPPLSAADYVVHGGAGGGILPEVVSMDLGVGAEKAPAAALEVVGGGVVVDGGTPAVMGGGGGGIEARGGWWEWGFGEEEEREAEEVSFDLLNLTRELFANTAGGDFTPHVVTVHTGEDVAGKILTFAQKGHRGICVLSANGSVSNVTLRQPGTSGGLLTYEGNILCVIRVEKVIQTYADLSIEYVHFVNGQSSIRACSLLRNVLGRFEILTLTGSYTVSDNGGIKSRSGGLSVSLASPDGRVIGGGVAGLLMAANPIQIVVGSFVPNGFKMQKRKPQSEPRMAPAAHCPPATVTAATPISQAPPETNIYPNPPSQYPGEADNSLSNKDQPNSASTDNTADWNGADHHRAYPDINISVSMDEH